MHDVPDILKASYDNADVAFALGHHNFPDFRKNLERHGLVTLPRIDENPARPKFRIGHVYEYALNMAVNLHMSREGAAAAVRNLFSYMSGCAVHRLNALDDETRNAIMFDGMWNRYVEESSIKTQAEYGQFVDYPWLFFNPEVLDRTDERKTKPLIWVLPPGHQMVSREAMLVDGPEVNIVSARQHFTERLRKINIDPNAVEPIRSINTIDVTDLLSEVDRRLNIRLHARRLRGEM